MKKLLPLLLFVALLPLAPIPAPAADYSVTATSVLCSESAVIRRKFAGATITAGQALSLNASDAVVLFDANVAAPVNVFIGIALNGGAAGQPISYVERDPEFTPGFTVAAGAIVIGSGTAGGLAPAADLTTGWYLTIAGVGIGSNKINLNPFPAGVATP